MIAVIELDKGQVRTVGVDWRNQSLSIGKFKISFQFLKNFNPEWAQKELSEMTDIPLEDILLLLNQVGNFDDPRLEIGPVFLSGGWVLWKGEP